MINADRQGWLAAVAVGDLVAVYAGSDRMQDEVVTSVTATLIAIGRYRRRKNFRRADGRMAGRMPLAHMFYIASPDEQTRPAPIDRWRDKAVQLDDVKREPRRTPLLDQYRGQAWPVEQIRAACPAGPGVYMLWRGPRLMYIGSSVALDKRVFTQRRRQPTKVTTIRTGSVVAARSLESRLIVELLPLQNQVAYVPHEGTTYG